MFSAACIFQSAKKPVSLTDICTKRKCQVWNLPGEVCPFLHMNFRAG